MTSKYTAPWKKFAHAVVPPSAGEVCLMQVELDYVHFKSDIFKETYSLLSPTSVNF